MKIVTQKAEILADYESEIAEVTEENNSIIDALDPEIPYEEKIRLLNVRAHISERLYRLNQELPYLKMKYCIHIMGSKTGIDELSQKPILKCFCPRCGLRNFLDMNSKKGLKFLRVMKIYEDHEKAGYLKDKFLTAEEIDPDEFERIYKVARRITGSDDDEIIRAVMLSLLERRKALRSGKQKIKMHTMPNSIARVPVIKD